MLLGSGGMGEVYLAQDTRLGRQVALKFLSSEYTQNQERVGRFQQEARAASALNHPNLITIYDIGEEDSTHFIATEYIDGETLRQRIRSGPMVLTEVCDIAIQVATALSVAHSAGIIHRDIKPENVMIRPDGLAKVLDFGLAKLSDTPSRLGGSNADPMAPTRQVKTEFGMVMGTINYMSPEQARGMKVDARTDIFSLGVVMYEMVAGRVPFEGSTFSDVIAAILGKRPVTLARFLPDISPEMERIVDKALAKDREERYQTIKDLLIDLKKLRKRLDLDVKLDETMPDPPPMLPTTARISDPSGAAVATSRNPSRDPSRGPSGATTREPSFDPGRPTSLISAERSLSSAEYIVSEIKRHKKGFGLALAALAVAVVAVLYFTARSKPIDSVAVLPLAGIGEDPAMKRIGDAVTQRFINGLSQLPGIKVKSFNSVLRYAGQPVDPQEAGRELGVRALLMGTMMKREPDGLFISLELINTQDNSIIWGEQYEPRFADIRRVQEDVLRAISARLEVTFSEEERQRREAERLYQEGRNLWEKRTSDALKRAIESFQQAIAIDANSARSHAGIADCYNMLGTYGVMAPKEAFPEAKRAAEQAIRIDPSLAEAHTALAFALYRGDWNWAEAETRFRRALELNPSYAPAHQWYANYLTAKARHREAEDETRRTSELEPTSLVINAHFGFVYYFAGRYDDVITASEKTLALDPNFFIARRYLGWAYEAKGMYEQSVAQFRQAVARSNNSPHMRAELAHALARSGATAEAEQLLGDLLELSRRTYVSPYHIALIYVGLGDKARALEWLETALNVRADFLVYVKVDPRLALLHAEPRYQEIVRQVGLN
jgi:serine/threonine-protein kinase